MNDCYSCKDCSAVNGTDDREAHSKFWIAACTRPKSEKKASSALRRFGIETYVPIQTEIRQWSDRKKKIDVVVIPNIIFALIIDSDINIIRQSPLITKILSMPGDKNPYRIPTTQIERLRFMLEESESPIAFITSNITSNFKKKDNVIVIRGNLKGLIGSVEKISESRCKLIVYVDLLGGAMMEIGTADLKISDVIP